MDNPDLGTVEPPAALVLKEKKTVQFRDKLQSFEPEEDQFNYANPDEGNQMIGQVESNSGLTVFDSEFDGATIQTEEEFVTYINSMPLVHEFEMDLTELYRIYEIDGTIDPSSQEVSAIRQYNDVNNIQIKETNQRVNNVYGGLQTTKEQSSSGPQKFKCGSPWHQRTTHLKKSASCANHTVVAVVKIRNKMRGDGVDELEVLQIDIPRYGIHPDFPCDCIKLIPGKTNCSSPTHFTSGPLSGQWIGGVGERFCADLEQCIQNGGTPRDFKNYPCDCWSITGRPSEIINLFQKNQMIKSFTQLKEPVAPSLRQYIPGQKREKEVQVPPQNQSSFVSSVFCIDSSLQEGCFSIEGSDVNDLMSINAPVYVTEDDYDSDDENYEGIVSSFIGSVFCMNSSLQEGCPSTEESDVNSMSVPVSAPVYVTEDDDDWDDGDYEGIVCNSGIYEARNIVHISSVISTPNSDDPRVEEQETVCQNEVNPIEVYQDQTQLRIAAQYKDEPETNSVSPMIEEDTKSQQGSRWSKYEEGSDCPPIVEKHCTTENDSNQGPDSNEGKLEELGQQYEEFLDKHVDNKEQEAFGAFVQNHLDGTQPEDLESKDKDGDGKDPEFEYTGNIAFARSKHIHEVRQRVKRFLKSRMEDGLYSFINFSNYEHAFTLFKGTPSQHDGMIDESNTLLRSLGLNMIRKLFEQEFEGVYDRLSN